MKYILTILLVFSLNIAKSQCLEMDIMLVADYSDSIDGHEEFVEDAFNEFIDRFELHENGVRIGIIAFSDYPFMLSKLSTNKNKLRKVTRTMDGVFHRQSTNMYGALNATYKYMEKNSRENARKMIIVVSDGAFNGSPEKLPELVYEIKKEGINICGVLIKSEYQTPQNMLAISNDFCYFESTYQMLSEVLKNMDVCF